MKIGDLVYDSILTVDDIVSTLNNWLDGDELWEYFASEFECEREKIVNQFGFGYDEEGIKMIAGDYLEEITLSIEELSTTITNASKGNKQDRINAINFIFTQTK